MKRARTARSPGANTCTCIGIPAHTLYGERPLYWNALLPACKHHMYPVLNRPDAAESYRTRTKTSGLLCRLYINCLCAEITLALKPTACKYRVRLFPLNSLLPYLQSWVMQLHHVIGRILFCSEMESMCLHRERFVGGLGGSGCVVWTIIGSLVGILWWLLRVFFVFQQMS